MKIKNAQGAQLNLNVNWVISASASVHGYNLLMKNNYL